MTNPDLKNTIEKVQGAVPITIFHLHGWLDAQSEGELVKWAEEAFKSGVRYLLLDLNEVDMLTSAGMRAIQKVYQMYTPKEADKNYSCFKMAAAPPQAYNALQMAGFLKSIPAYESVQSAIESFEAPTKK